ncbi:MAG: DEAD/DEAH box helicase [Pirellulaceae bacterium]
MPTTDWQVENTADSGHNQCMNVHYFHPLVRDWFQQRFGAPTEPQALGWPHIEGGRHTLIAAPTGSGKTLAAFLVCIDRLLRQHLEGTLEDRLEVMYVSPLKALSNDIQRNLQTPLAEISRLAEEAGCGALPVRAVVRTGDTPSSERQKMLRRPPHILATTPESLYLLLTSEQGRERLRSVKTVIVDEIHALARDKRGSHLALSLERLADVCDAPPVRIGLSATQRPIEQIARFLVGHRDAAGKEPTCEIVDVGHVRQLDLSLLTPESEMQAVCSHEQWDEIYGKLVELIHSHRSTLIFVNTRRLAERVAHRLTEILGEDAVASHHGSLSRKLRLSAEQRLKEGSLRAIVATASLEMGIDVGYIDLVCQIGSPRSIATFLQRVGRSGHSLGATPKGRLVPLTRDELLECMALVRSVRRGELDRIEIPQQPLDILAQQIVAAVACEEYQEDDLFALMRRAWPYRDLSRDDFDAVVDMLSRGVVPKTKRGAYLHRDRINGRLRARRGARIAALTSGGAIPENAEYRVVTGDEKTFVGTVDEDFAVESMAGDVFLLGNTSWRVRAVRGGEVIVDDAHGAPPSVPFWLGEAPGRTVELSTDISRLREDIAGRFNDNVEWLWDECGADADAAIQAVRYVQAQVEAIGLVPTEREIVFERFFDESGGMQLVVHSPLGARINRAWGLALRKRFCRSFDFELQAAATDNGIVLSLSPQHSFPIDRLFAMLRTDNARYLLEQALLAAPMFQVRWRWNVTRALAVMRMQGGKKVPPFLQRFRSDDLLAAVFPETVGCLENHHGDIEAPDHPLVRQTMHDCLHEAMDLPRWLEVLAKVEASEIQLIARDTREPSPFCHELLNANPYAFLDDAPLEERRSRAVSTRRTLSTEDFRDLARLDPQAIDDVRTQAWPLVRDADELHDALLNLVVLREDELGPWREFLPPLVRENRALQLEVLRPQTQEEISLWIAAEQLPLIRAVYDLQSAPKVACVNSLEEGGDEAISRSAAWVEMVRGRLSHCGPVTTAWLAERLVLDESHVASACEALEGEGVAMRGRFTAEAQDHPSQPGEWCDRRLLARIHRQTLDGLRRRIQPVEPEVFLRFLLRHQKIVRDEVFQGAAAVREIIAQLQGFELAAGAWEQRVLSARVDDYETSWLDELFFGGELVWGRLRGVRREESDERRMAALTRTVPLSLALRDDLPWLLSDVTRNAAKSDLAKAANTDRLAAVGKLRSDALSVYEALAERGALFFQQLTTATQLLPTQLEDALRQLAALGLVTCDAYASIRALADRKSAIVRRRGGRSTTSGAAAKTRIGRWSCFPGDVAPCDHDDWIEHWCRQLLRRYGVVFRELLVRESAAPPWRLLVALLRRLELRGEVRGGRFVSGVSGEQFALEHVVGALRALRDKPAEEEPWLVVSAADPSNLVGIVTPGARVAATHRNSLVLQGGELVACKQGGQVDFFREVPMEQRHAMVRALHLGRRLEQQPSHIRGRWTAADVSPELAARARVGRGIPRGPR